MEVRGAFAQVLAEADNDERRMTTRPPPGSRARVLMAVSISTSGRRNRHSHLLNSPMIFASASVLKCKLKPTTAADVSTFALSLSTFTANTVKR
jgi:hypothetical protein